MEAQLYVGGALSRAPRAAPSARRLLFAALGARRRRHAGGVALLAARSRASAGRPLARRLYSPRSARGGAGTRGGGWALLAGAPSGGGRGALRRCGRRGSSPRRGRPGSWPRRRAPGRCGRRPGCTPSPPPRCPIPARRAGDRRARPAGTTCGTGRRSSGRSSAAKTASSRRARRRRLSPARLAKPMPGSRTMPLAGHAGGLRQRHAGLELGPDLAHHFAVARRARTWPRSARGCASARTPPGAAATTAPVRDPPAGR